MIITHLTTFLTNFYLIYNYFKKSFYSNLIIYLFITILVFLFIYYINNLVISIITIIIWLLVFFWFLFFITLVFKYYSRLKKIKSDFTFLKTQLPIYALLYFMESDKNLVEKKLKEMLLSHNFLEKVDNVINFYYTCMQDNILFDETSLFFKEKEKFNTNINQLIEALND